MAKLSEQQMLKKLEKFNTTHAIPNGFGSLDAALAWADEPGNAILTLADAAYPQRLLDAPDPPTVLYVKGRIELLNAPALAIVGSRNATPQGESNAEAFAAALADAGLTIVSGLALGIDAAAHRGGLRRLIGPGRTVPRRHHPGRRRYLAADHKQNAGRGGEPVQPGAPG